MRDAGFDVGYAPHETAAAEARVDAIYEHARVALYAAMDPAVLRDVVPQHTAAQTLASDRDDYIAHPPSGEQLAPASVDTLTRLHAERRTPQVQFVVSDGLNAHAINEQLRLLLPAIRRQLIDRDIHVADGAVVVTNGRVRAGYHAGAILDPHVVVHIIGVRPGTGLNTASAYLTYGRDEAGRPRWSPELDHSCTTAVCGIHPRGKPPESAAAEIARTVARMIEIRRSGVQLLQGSRLRREQGS